MSKPKQPSAFPHDQRDSHSMWSDGMTLRDYFAAKALPVVFEDFFTGLRLEEYAHPGETWRRGVAKEAFRIADAMIEERKNHQENE